MAFVNSEGVPLGTTIGEDVIIIATMNEADRQVIYENTGILIITGFRNGTAYPVCANDGSVLVEGQVYRYYRPHINPVKKQ